MGQLQEYQIPENVRAIGIHNDVSSFNALKNMVDGVRFIESSYISAFTDLIHLEEFADSTNISKFDIKNVRFQSFSPKDNIYKIKYDVRTIRKKYSYGSVIQ